MAKKRPKRKNKQPKQQKSQETPELKMGQPWISRQSGLQVMGFVSLALAAFMVWQLYPTEGWMSLLWGLGFGLAIWGVFGVSLIFNTWMRGRHF